MNEVEQKTNQEQEPQQQQQQAVQQDQQIQPQEGEAEQEEADKNNQPQKLRVFVGGISARADFEDIEQYFSQIGNLESCKIKINKKTGRCIGYGYLTCSDQETFDKIVNEKHTVNGRMIDCKPLLKKEKLAQMVEDERSRKIFVGNLESTTTGEDLAEYFKKYGAIKNSYIICHPGTNESRCFGFVHFEEKESVENAFTVDKHFIGKKEVSCNRFLNKKEQMEFKMHGINLQGNSNSYALAKEKWRAELEAIEHVFVFNLPMSCLPPDLFTGSSDASTKDGEHDIPGLVQPVQEPKKTKKKLEDFDLSGSDDGFEEILKSKKLQNELKKEKKLENRQKNKTPHGQKMNMDNSDGYMQHSSSKNKPKKGRKRDKSSNNNNNFLEDQSLEMINSNFQGGGFRGGYNETQTLQPEHAKCNKKRKAGKPRQGRNQPSYAFKDPRMNKQQQQSLAQDLFADIDNGNSSYFQNEFELYNNEDDYKSEQNYVIPKNMMNQQQQQKNFFSPEKGNFQTAVPRNKLGYYPKKRSKNMAQQQPPKNRLNSTNSPMYTPGQQMMPHLNNYPPNQSPPQNMPRQQSNYMPVHQRPPQGTYPDHQSVPTPNQNQNHHPNQNYQNQNFTDYSEFFYQQSPPITPPQQQYQQQQYPQQHQQQFIQPPPGYRGGPPTQNQNAYQQPPPQHQQQNWQPKNQAGYQQQYMGHPQMPPQRGRGNSGYQNNS